MTFKEYIAQQKKLYENEKKIRNSAFILATILFAVDVLMK